MQFEWDENKNRSNLAKHNLSFQAATEVFFSICLTAADTRTDYGEKRWISVGEISPHTVIVVVYTIRDEKYRIISARKANDRERRKYYEHIRGPKET
jgi:uncharacterized protein